MDNVLPKTVCLVCLKDVFGLEDGLECDGSCKRWFHRDCTEMPNTEYANISSNTNHKWYCNRFHCRTGVASLFDRLVETLAKLSDQITTLSGKIDSLSTLPEKVDRIQSHLNWLNEKLTAHETRIGQVYKA